jgi:dolichol-phosphate mannosyltransferase
MSLSLVIPVYNESTQILSTLNSLAKFKRNIKDFEIILIDDFSNDNTQLIIKKFIKKKKYIKIIKNKKKGLGSAIQNGILYSNKKFVCIFMADMSDNLNDVLRYYKLIVKEDLDAVLGSRFIKKSKIINYPLFKLLLNRIFNTFIKFLFLSNYNDFTNAFKMYKRKTVLRILPVVSENFNVFLEIPLKIIIRKYNYKIIPISWKNRKKGTSKFKIVELGSMYLFTMLYCLLEKILINKKK